MQYTSRSPYFALRKSRFITPKARDANRMRGGFSSALRVQLGSILNVFILENSPGAL